MTFPECDINPSEGYLWLHVSLLSIAAIIVIASFVSQLKDTAPYGRHALNNPAAKDWGFPIPQRIGHIISDALPGIFLFLFVYLMYAGFEPFKAFSQVDGVNIVLVIGWLAHYVYRGVIHPLVTPYSARSVAVGITLAGIFPNCLFSYLIAAQIGCTKYPRHWSRDPRFIIGVVLYCVGYGINRWADLTLRRLRLKARHANDRSPPRLLPSSDLNAPISSLPDASPPLSHSISPPPSLGEKNTDPKLDLRVCKPDVQSLGYIFPQEGLFKIVICPNYFGEMVEWFGFALASWSYPSLGWALFATSTFIPRSLAHRKWYWDHFPEEMARYGPNRKALIPGVL
mmetsp:Transcript_9307/g.17428  ORF Transcript_9307/g.17428 Transcript_9307/m.17428 type:complete len:341 (-) Transcript_9307:153-1175(-)